MSTYAVVTRDADTGKVTRIHGRGMTFLDADRWVARLNDTLDQSVPQPSYYATINEKELES